MPTGLELSVKYTLLRLEHKDLAIPFPHPELPLP